MPLGKASKGEVKPREQPTRLDLSLKSVGFSVDFGFAARISRRWAVGTSSAPFRRTSQKRRQGRWREPVDSC